jgi:hypothetical protein
MEVMGKCPYFGKPCLKEDCSAFYYEQRCLYDDVNNAMYKHFKKERVTWSGKQEWFAVNIPYCRAMKMELPIDKSGKP